ncbi:MAG: HD domain-containing protein [Bacteroidaceae bacterium]|nr:HD domain-containing protein [Bacteroidaceae bacterium]
MKNLDPIDVIRKYYPEDNALRRLLLHHSRQVAERALLVAEKHPELGLDKSLLRAGAMLHDVGIFLTDAPGIHCHGTEPYLLHGYLGAQLMRAEELGAIAHICERHTGTGLTMERIRERGLSLPEGIYAPATLEEQVVCYADKFYSKSHPERERTIEQTAQSLQKFGEEDVQRFLAWAERFE